MIDDVSSSLTVSLFLFRHQTTSVPRSTGEATLPAVTTEAAPPVAVRKRSRSLSKTRDAAQHDDKSLRSKRDAQRFERTYAIWSRGRERRRSRSRSRSRERSHSRWTRDSSRVPSRLQYWHGPEEARRELINLVERYDLDSSDISTSSLQELLRYTNSR
jgi:hypothetical protein